MSPGDMTPLEHCLQPNGPLRPTFCNVPEWAQWFLYVAGLVAILIFAYGIYMHWKAWMAGQGTIPERNAGAWRTRAGFVGRYVFGQQKTLERRFPGIFHTGLFWGFVLLFIGTVLATLDWDVTGLLFGARFLRGPFYLAYELVLDAAGLFFVLGLLMAMWRRYMKSPGHVTAHWEFVLWSLFIVNVTGFLVEGLRLALVPVAWSGFSFVGAWVADLIFLLPDAVVRQETLEMLHLTTWLFHAVAALAFIAAIPYTNAVHMVTAATNAVLKTVEPVAPGAALAPVDIEHAEVYGVGSLAHFSPKQRLGVDSCLRCGRCETVCPAHLTGTPLNPKRVIVNLSEGLRSEVEPGLPTPAAVADGHGQGGDGHGALAVNGGEVMIGSGGLIEPDALWSCTTCMACVEVCPAFIEIVDDIVDMRRYLALMEGALPGTSGATLRNMTTAGNPWGYAPEERTHWAEGLDVPRAKPGEHYSYLYFVGCSASYDKRNQKIARAVAMLLNRAGVSYAILEQERCNCESARRLGEEYLYQTATEENVSALGEVSFDRVLAHCPHCFNTLKNEYAQFGGSYEVVHHTQLIRDLVADGRLEAPGAGGARVAFHDSCYLGRYNGEFQAPRDTLAAAGVDVLEMDRSRENGLCCGGGGGKMWFEGHEERSVGALRMEEALALQPDAVGVACPFCLTMLESARSSMGADDVRIMDVAELFAEGLADESPGPEPAGMRDGV